MRSCGKTSLIASMNSFMNSSIYRRYKKKKEEWINETVFGDDDPNLSGVGSLPTYPKVQRISEEFFCVCAQVETNGQSCCGFDASTSDVQVSEFQNKLEKAREIMRRATSLQFSNGYGKSIGTKVTQTENTRAWSDFALLKHDTKSVRIIIPSVTTAILDA